MGNQARLEPGSTYMSTSTRNFEGRMGEGCRVYLGSAELAAVTAILGRVPTPDEYMETVVHRIDPMAAEIYRYLNFDQLTQYREKAAMAKT